MVELKKMAAMLVTVVQVCVSIFVDKCSHSSSAVL